MAEQGNNGGNGWRAGTSERIGVLQGELNAIHRLLADPETGLGALHRKVSGVRDDMLKMRLLQFGLGGFLVGLGVILGGGLPGMGQRILSLTARVGEWLGAG